jgi:phage tail sheath gpL-like
MSVPFKQIPPNILTPLTYFELDASKANNAVTFGRGLIIGQMITSAGSVPLTPGDATPNVAVQSLSPADAKSRFGLGSMLAKMVLWYRKRDTQGELWCLPLADDGAAAAATGTITFTGPATAAGVLSLYIAGHYVPVPVSSAMTATALATAVAAAINLITDLAVTAVAAAAVVTLTAKNKGLAENDIDLRVNYRGAPGGEATPAGITVVFAAMSGGSVNPSLTAALGNLSDQPFDFIVCPYTDTTSLAALKAFLGDQAGRWSYSSQQFGHVFSAVRGTVSTRTTFGTALNDQHLSVIGFYDSPTPAWLWAANFGGAAAASLRASPALPLQTLPLDVLAPPVASRDTQPQRNVLLYDGLSTVVVAQDGTVLIDDAVTTYQQNAFGQPDDSYRQVETLFTLAEVVRRFRTMIQTKYGRVKLADSAASVAAAPSGTAVVTTNTIRADMIALARSMEGDLLENVDAFAKNLVVERDTTSRRRVNVLLPPDLIDSIGVLALLVQFQS